MSALSAARARLQIARPMSPEEEERQWVVAAQAGDHRAFESLYSLYASSVFSFVKMRVNDTGLAEELTQEIFVRAYRGLPRFEWQGSLGPWIMRIARNQIANHWRSVSRRPDSVKLPSEDDPDENMPEIAAWERQYETIDRLVLDASSDRVMEAMSELTDLQQQVLALRFGSEMSLKDTAEIMGRSINAVKNLQHKALGALRRSLEPEGIEG
jgi:RNA polymerase sigma-70 factor (ECF subfamily)